MILLKTRQGMPVLEYSVDRVWFSSHLVEGFLVLMPVQRLTRVTVSYLLIDSKARFLFYKLNHFF